MSAQLWVQINHAGRQTPKISNPLRFAPSAIDLKLASKNFGQSQVLSKPSIMQIIKGFIISAVAAKLA